MTGRDFIAAQIELRDKERELEELKQKTHEQKQVRDGLSAGSDPAEGDTALTTLVLILPRLTNIHGTLRHSGWSN